MKKTERLLALVLALKKKGKMTAGQLAAFLEVNIRTIYRDIDALSQMGVPLMACPGKEGGYEIVEEYFLPSVSFTRDEVLALSIARELIHTAEIPGFDPFISSAFLKIDNITPGDESERIQRVTDRILFDFKYIDPPPMDKSDFQLIRRALEENRCLTISYYSARRGETKRRFVFPWILMYSDGVWYLRGKSDGKSFLWWFRLDRIRSVELSEEIFSLPGDFDKRSLSFSSNLNGGFEIEIALNRSLYELVREDLIFQQSDVEESGDEILLSFTTDRKELILEFLFRNPIQARLLGPLSLLDEMRERLNALGNVYS